MTGTLTFVVVPKGGVDDARGGSTASEATGAEGAAAAAAAPAPVVANGRLQLHSTAGSQELLAGVEPAAAVAPRSGAGRPCCEEVVSEEQE